MRFQFGLFLFGVALVLIGVGWRAFPFLGRLILKEIDNVKKRMGDE